MKNKKRIAILEIGPRMTDKEEKIGIINVKKQCKNCRISAEEFDGICPDCKECPVFTETMTRAEAVERIARAKWDKDQKRLSELYKDFVVSRWETLERPSPGVELYLQEAEAALDALLEAKK